MKRILSPLIVGVLAAGSAAQAPEQTAARTINLDPPREILANGKSISVPVGYVAPFLADWDGDGLDDLLVGQFGYGRMRIYKNIGTRVQPEYGDFTYFQAGGTTGSVPTG